MIRFLGAIAVVYALCVSANAEVLYQFNATVPVPHSTTGYDFTFSDLHPVAELPITSIVASNLMPGTTAEAEVGISEEATAIAQALQNGTSIGELNIADFVYVDVENTFSDKILTMFRFAVGNDVVPVRSGTLDQIQVNFQILGHPEPAVPEPSAAGLLSTILLCVFRRRSR